MAHRIASSSSKTRQLMTTRLSMTSFRILLFFVFAMESVKVNAFFEPAPTGTPMNTPGNGLWVDDDDIVATTANTTAATSIPTTSPIQSPPPPTPAPVVPPTPVPSKAPTKRPTKAPTKNPTPGPTPFPTPLPTALPTKNPTPFPTKSPTASPSKRPTPAPTKAPTKAPTPPPTPLPTPGPTEPPSQSPTSRPTRLPSAAPSRRPTPTPTKPPTQTPSRFPTGRPSVSPTREDSSLPTPSPSLSPTEGPSIPPTPFPSQQPSKVPTTKPSKMPTNIPSMLPSASPAPSSSPTTPQPSSHPSYGPTMEPSLEPSSSPSSEPSQSPSLPQQEVLIVAFMTLAPYRSTTVLSGTSSIAFERATREHVFQQIKLLDIEPQLLELSVQTDIKSQVPPEAPSAADQSNDVRLLQNARFANNSLIVEFNVFVTFRSVSNDHDLDEFVFSAWDAPGEKESFINRLKSLSSFFQNIEEVNVEVEGFIPKRPDPVDPDDDGPDIAVIAGGAGGGALLLLLCGYLYVRSKSEKEAMNDYDQTKATTQSGQRIAAEILVEPQDEVSTLGDPMFAPGGMLIGSFEKDEVTASVGDDYDYARQYRNERNPASLAGDRSRLMSEEYTKSSSVNSASMMSKLGRMGESLFADDASFEQQFAQPEERFDIVAPAGKLGMVIDTPNGGFPVVHAIKDTSVLSDRVHVGDRLLSVDGDDCTGMTAMQVSKLISLKSEKPARVLVFARCNASPIA